MFESDSSNVHPWEGKNEPQMEDNEGFSLFAEAEQIVDRQREIMERRSQLSAELNQLTEESRKRTENLGPINAAHAEQFRNDIERIMSESDSYNQELRELKERQLRLFPQLKHFQ